ncbi:hypothetical protein ACH4HG_15250 [Streptomyces coeruleorubidus]|uniref:hypothetical protein n=1 Tax=Streptomyces coeruleorubidus TaxID=116188 RepID=UPI0018764E77|nr:hypothetical protein [Streptomyces bellus]GGU15827.1 hypothetical protein GCM10010244_48080 [Streptomyces bellus]
MSARRRIVAAWAGVCLAGLVGTYALNAESPTGGSGSPAGEPTPTGTYAVDCQEIADQIEQARAEALREHREAFGPSPTVGYQSVIVGDVAVPEECAEELEDLGMGEP